MKKLLSLILIGILVLPFCAYGASTQAPSSAPLEMPASLRGKTVSWYIGFSAGGQTDLGARKVAQIVTEQTGLNVVIVNLEGAGGAVAVNQVMGARPDGTTLVSIGSSAMAQMAQDQIKHKTDDMSFISSMYSNTMGLFVRADSPIKTLEDFEKAIKEGQPGDYPVGISGYLNPSESMILLLGELMNAKEILYPVRYPGDSRAATELMGGSVKFINVLPGAMKPLVESGEIRELISGTYKRRPDAPDVPAMTELSFWGDTKVYSDFIYLNNYVLGPKGMPEDVTAWMAQAWYNAVTSDAFRQQADEWGVVIEPVVSLEECKQAAQDTVDSYREYLDRLY